jgi:hypothetical protein
MTANPKKATQADAGFARLLENWLPLTHALNSLNRGMGLPDLYPFVLSTPAIEKLRFIHETVREVPGTFGNINSDPTKTPKYYFESSRLISLTAS